MTDLVTTLMEVLGLLLLAAGATAALVPLIGWSALAAGGLVLIGGSALVAWRMARPPKEPTDPKQTGR